MVLDYGNVQYENSLVDFQSFRAMKPSLKYGQIPQFTLDNGQKLVQTSAIMRYIGKTFRGKSGEFLYPADAELMYKIDQILERNNEFYGAYSNY